MIAYYINVMCRSVLTYGAVITIMMTTEDSILDIQLTETCVFMNVSLKGTGKCHSSAGGWQGNCTCYDSITN